MANLSTGEKLKYLRMIKGYSQKELAEKLDLSQAVITWWEQNRGTPEDTNKKKLSNLYGISVDTLFFNDNVEHFAKGLVDVLLEKAN